MHFEKRLLPTIKCKNCLKVFFLYKWSDKKNDKYTNSASNILSHAKCTHNLQPRITQYKDSPLPNDLRQDVVEFYAHELCQHNTISFLAGTQLLNECAKFISKLTIKCGKTYNYDISRQNVSDTTNEVGKENLENNLNYFFKNAQNSSVIIDHWSHHGYNFFGIIGRTVNKKYSCDEYLLSFAPASADKTADGIYKNLLDVLPPITTPIPIISDNCATMVAALNGYKNSGGREKVFKIYCIEHFVAKIDEKIHAIDFVRKLDKQINAIDSYFNYRHHK